MTLIDFPAICLTKWRQKWISSLSGCKAQWGECHLTARSARQELVSQVWLRALGPSFCTFVTLSLFPVLCFQPQPVTLLIGQNVLEIAYATASIMCPLTRRDHHTCALAWTRPEGSWKSQEACGDWSELTVNEMGTWEEAGRHCSLLLSHKWMGQISGAPQSSGCLLSGDILHVEATSSFDHTLTSSLFAHSSHFYFPGTVQSLSIKVITHKFVSYTLFSGTKSSGNLLTRLCRDRHYFDIHSAK